METFEIYKKSELAQRLAEIEAAKKAAEAASAVQAASTDVA